MDRDVLEALADVSEDLAIELTAAFTESDYQYLTKSVLRLYRAVDLLHKYDYPVPAALEQIVGWFRDAQSRHTQCG